MILTLNKSLNKVNSEPKKHQELIFKLENVKKDYKTKTKTQSLFHVENNLIGDCSHRNYMDYLLAAWDSHMGIVVTPDIIWYSLLCELTSIVAEDPEKYRSIFSTSNEKQDIVIQSDSLTIMPLGKLMTALAEKVPTDIQTFLPGFTTTTDRSQLAQYAAFADMASPYYNYMMFLCGFPAIDVRGNKEDWQTILANWKTIRSIFNSHDEYFEKVSVILTNLVDSLNNADFWKEMFKLEQCGSGHQYEVFGWFADMFRIDPNGERFPENFSSHISVVKYLQLDTQKNYEMKQGVFCSKKEDDFMIPEFAHIIYEKTKDKVLPYEV